MFNQKGNLVGILSGFALELNRTRYEPVTLEFLKILANRADVDTSFLQNPQSFYLAKGPGGNTSDGTNSLIKKRIAMAIPANKITSHQTPTFYMLHLPSEEQQTISNDSDELEWLTGTNYIEQYGIASCAFTYAEAKRQKYEKPPIDLSLFNQPQYIQEQAGLISIVQQKEIENNRQKLKLTFGFFQNEYLFRAETTDFTISYQNGQLTISDKKENIQQSFRDPNGCYRVVKIAIPNKNKSFIYNISYSTVSKETPARRALFEIFIKRAILDVNNNIEEYQYYEARYRRKTNE